MSCLDELQEKMVAENFGLIHFVIHKYFHFDRNDYDDMFQVGSMALCKAAQRYEVTTGTFATFAVKVIQNEICRELRFQHTPRRCPAIPNLSLDYEMKVGENLFFGDTIENGEDQISDMLSIVAIQSALETLDPDEKEIIDMYFHGKTQAEIGKAVGLHQAVVSRRIRRARNKLKIQLAS